MQYNELEKCIYQYDNCIDYSSKLINYVQGDKLNWRINSEEAANWTSGKQIFGYDEYLLMYSFRSPIEILNFGKTLFDHASHYSQKNLFTFNDISQCVVRRYIKDKSFLQIESPDQDIPSSKAMSITFLKDIDEGGELYFDKFDLSVKPTAGSTIFFPANFAYSFKINRPKNEKNYLVISNFS